VPRRTLSLFSIAEDQHQEVQEVHENNHNGHINHEAAVTVVQEAGSSPVTTVDSEEELLALISDGTDTIVKLAFTWCRPCKGFWPKYQKFAKVYNKTRFIKIVGNSNESCKHYARDVLRAKISPMFAAYSGGELVTTWNGANNGRFIEKMEENLPTARELRQERIAAVEKDATIRPI